ncbi:MAG TPA: efflux RND transporter periplasmic adaptor subunit [Polyangiales bacterium]|nr:efflux RND transporter periplasmic adaptor subunit [Polyangiales bacterium]
MWLSFAVALLAAAAGYYLLRPKPVPLSARFRVQQVTRGDVLREVHATGHAEALTTVQVGAEISGRIASVDVDFNQYVRAGQVLARFDRGALQAQLAQTQATLAAARTALEQAKAELAQSARARERAARLHAQNSVSDAELDLAEASARVAEQRVRAAEAQIAAQTALLALAQTNLSHAEIRAPIDGIVITRNIDPGQSVASVLQAPTLFTVAADLRLMRVVAAVDEADIGEVKDLQRARFTVNAYPDRTFEGTVVEVRNSPVVIQDVVTYGTVIETENLDLALKPGMTASVRIQTAQAPNVLRVPNAALHFNPPREPRPDGRGVWLLSGERLRYQPVHAGLSDGELTAIAATDLAEGTQVIVELTPAGRSVYGVGS